MGNITTLSVLTALKLVGAHASVSDLADFLDEPHDLKSLSARLCRMRNHGYCTSEMKNSKNLWTLTKKGQQELEKSQELHQQSEPQINPELDSEPQPTPEAEPQPDQQTEPEFVSEHEYEPDPIARELLEAMELELALDNVKWRLQAAHIPVRTARVYREIVAALPPVLQKSLEPLTALIESAH